MTYRYPNITGTTNREQLHQLKSYLYQLVEQLNNTVPAGSLGTGPQTGVAIASGKETAENFAALKGLIIKSADIVNAYTESIGKNLAHTYVAQSEFGTFTRQADSSITANALAIDQCYTYLEQVMTDMEREQQQTRAYIRTGMLYYAGPEDPLPEGTPVYGVEVGQQTDGAFLRLGRFTAQGMTFYDENGAPAAQITQGRMTIPHGVVELSFTRGGFRDEVLPDGTLLTRWHGV